MGIPANPLTLLDEFHKFCKVDLGLSDRSIEDYAGNIKLFARWLPKSLLEVTREDLRNFILERYSDCSPNTKANIIRSFRCFYKRFLNSPITDSFRYPAIPIIPKSVPSKEQLAIFYESLPTKEHKLIFLLLASSGLRVCEIIGLRKGDLQQSSRSIKPHNHEGSTKKCWLSFYSPECDELLSQQLEGRDGGLFAIHGQAVRKAFNEASVKCGFKIKPKDLRDWFASQMGELGIPDRYVDAFQGRVPASILARHYSDFNQGKLREIYEKANLRVLEMKQ